MSQTKAELLADSFGNSATGSIPIGGIIMWSGSIASIPTGWNLCNGSNNTPDLRNRFVIGALSDNSNTTYPNLRPNATGGSANAVLVAHDHPDNFTINAKFYGYRVTSNPADNIKGEANNTAYDKPTLEGGVQTRGLNANGDVNNSQSGVNANLPPYYALAYIMRVS